MIMKKIIFFLGLIYFLSGCKQIKCDEDIVLAKRMDYYFHFIDWAFYVDKNNLDVTFDLTEMRNILIYLISLTGIDDSEILDLEHPFPPKKKPNKLINRWKQWYNDNKCNLTISKADSITYAYQGYPFPNPKLLE